jgi:predicted alpha/beta superfamily hydrolase
MFQPSRLWMTVCVTSAIMGSLLQTMASGFSQDEVRIRLEVKIPAEDESSKDKSEDFFVAGSTKQLGQWRPDGLKLSRAEDGVFFAQFSAPVGSRVEFKVTRGSWQSVEKDEFGRDIANRELEVTASEDGALQTIHVTVERWGGERGGIPKTNQSTVTGTLKLHPQFASQHLPRTRTVGVWLPNDYDENDQSYPVLYLHDGQNLFDAATAAFGVEWQVDETAARLIKSREIQPIIIVGIWNTSDRIDEYTVTRDSRLERGGRGADYIRFVAEELKPFIDRTYRTRVERDATWIGGSSLGGLIAMHACLRKPEVFGHCLAFSPSLSWDNERLLECVREGSWPKETELWLSMGTREGRDSDAQIANTDRAQRLYELLVSLSANSPIRIHFQEFADASHDEKAWAAQLAVALRSMLGTEALASESDSP